MKIIAVVSMKGGVGKTSVTANLAAVLAQDAEPDSIAVLNLDPQNSLHMHLAWALHWKKVLHARPTSMATGVNWLSPPPTMSSTCRMVKSVKNSARLLKHA